MPPAVPTRIAIRILGKSPKHLRRHIAGVNIAYHIRRTRRLTPRYDRPWYRTYTHYHHMQCRNQVSHALRPALSALATFRTSATGDIQATSYAERWSPLPHCRRISF